VLATSGTYPWSFVTQMFRSSYPSQNFRSDDINLANRNPWLSSFLVSSNQPSIKEILYSFTAITYTYWRVKIVNSKYIYLLMRQRRLQQVHILTDASAQPPTSTCTYWSVNSLQVHILTDASTVYNKYIYSLMRQQSTTSTYIYWCVNTVYNKYIYLLMRQHSLLQVHIHTNVWAQSTASTKMYICSLMRQHSLQVHILTDASTQSTTSTYTYWFVNIVYNTYIYLLMRQHSLH
jgi:hypothetical protein